MTSSTHQMHLVRRLARTGAVVLLATAGTLQAQWSSSSATAQDNRSSTWSSGNAQSQAWQTDNRSQGQAFRGSKFIGTDVMSSEGRKLGDIVDFVFDTGQPQRLAYIVVMTGGFLDIGGEARVIPAEAVTFTGDQARTQINHSRFTQVPKITGDRDQFLSQSQNLTQIHQQFGLQDPRSTQGSSRSGSFITYSNLSRRDAVTQNGERIGFINDVWISQDRNQPPFVEVTPTINPFSTPGTQRFAIPMARLQSQGEPSNRYTFQVAMDDLTNARTISETPGVQIANEAFTGNTVLRVNVPTVASTQDFQQQYGAGYPTGFPSSQPSGSQPSYSASQTPGAQTYPQTQQPSYDPRSTGSSDQLRQAAQQIQWAIDNDSSLRQSNIQVLAQNDRIILAGSVGSEWLRSRVDEIAQRTAQGTRVDNQVRVYQGQ